MTERETTSTDMEPVGFVGLATGSTSTLFVRESFEPKSNLNPSASTFGSGAFGRSAFGMSEPEPEGVMFRGSMPDLEDLLKRHRIAYSVLERTTTPASAPSLRESRAWVALSLFASFWAFNMALAWVLPSFWLNPPTAIFGLLGSLVLIATAAVHSSSRKG